VSEPTPPQIFLDVPRLIEGSEPRPRSGWFGYGVAGLLLVLLMSALLVAGSEEGRNAARLMSAGVMIGIITAMAVLAVSTVKRHRAEQAMVEAAGELVQLRRWPQAGLILEQILSHPSPSHALRSQALIYLASVLARYHRFNDAITVHNHLLERELVDEGTAFGVRAGRAMAMLREDHLFDADRAISELRRLERTGESALLTLVEIYRDVKTGHPDEAIELFETRLPSLRDQLGHRLADAYALAARAYDLRGRKTEAQDAWVKATLLAPPGELLRRYPEVGTIAENYIPSPAPAEALG
jgi:tetratricopeptide (TPR) repeat protein